jgi:transitional endoplasmic reticulum ATPase
VAITLRFPNDVLVTFDRETKDLVVQRNEDLVGTPKQREKFQSLCGAVCALLEVHPSEAAVEAAFYSVLKEKRRETPNLDALFPRYFDDSDEESEEEEAEEVEVDEDGCDRRGPSLELGSGKHCADCDREIKSHYTKCWSCWDAHPHEETADECLAATERFDRRCRGPETVTEVAVNEGTGSIQKMTNEEKALEAKFKDTKLERRGTQIILPEGMPFSVAINWLRKMQVADEQVVAVNEVFDGADPFEGAVALHSALKEKFGWVQGVPTPGFFGDKPPQMINVPINFDTTVSVPWGRLTMPTIRGFLHTAIASKDGRPVFRLGGEVRQGDMSAVREICSLMKKYLKQESIYRNKAFKLSFPQNPEEASLEDFLPVFMDAKRVRREDLIFAKDIEAIVEHSVFTPILKTARLRRENIPRKRGVLLAGKFGTGKTLTAAIVAKLCVENNWTYVTIDDAKDLASAIEFAQRFQPAVVFCEDVDRAVRGERSAEMDTILNTIDGIKAKNTEVMVILTTNELDKINQAMIRPGRIDVIIPVAPPDAEAAQRLVRLYAKDKDGQSLLVDGADLTEVGLRLDGHIPAVIRETVERSKLAAISHLNDDEPLRLNGADLLAAAKELEGHNALLEPPPQDGRADVEKFGDAAMTALVKHAGKSPQVKAAVDSYLRTVGAASRGDAE